MINSLMKKYDYYLLPGVNEYGQQVLPDDAAAAGTIELAITEMSKSLTDNNLYSAAQYLGLTMAKIDDNYIIQYGENRLKVIYVTPSTRYSQVYLARM